jgi:hypothetical protein
MLRLLVCILLVSMEVAYAQAPDSQEALRPLSPEQKRDAMKVLAGFKCPEGASKEACNSFQELVRSGDSETLVPFLSVALPQKVTPAVVYVVFSDWMDNFWIVGSWGYFPKGANVDIFYERVFEGITRVIAMDTVPFVKGKAIQMSQDGVVVSFDGDSLTFSEQLATSTSSTVVKVSTLRAETTYKNGADTIRAQTRAFRVDNIN